MIPVRIIFLLCFFCFHACFSQVDSLVHSGLLLEKAKVFSDSGKWDLAIKELNRIEPRDTNYLKSLSVLVDLYLSKEDYNEVIRISKTGLQKPSSFRSKLLLAQGMAYTQMGEYEKAKSVFDDGSKEFPFYPGFVLQKAKMFYVMGDYPEAEKLFLKGLELSPFNSISHLHLGVISMVRGEKVRAMMAMGIYLAINNSNTKQLRLLEQFVKNEISDEFTVPPSDLNAFTRLDGIIRSKITIDEAYKIRIPVDAGIVRQYQLMFDQIMTQEFNPNDPWVSIYLPIYKQLVKSNLHDAFVYHLLSSASIKHVAEWLKKNEKTLNLYYDVVNTNLKQLRSTKVLPQLGFTNPVLCLYDEESRLESIGNMNEDKPIGLWLYYFPNGQLQAMGEYNSQGIKIGIWKYYNEAGFLTSLENKNNGLVERYTEEGKPWQKYHLVDGNVDGDVYILNSCGLVKEHLIYKQGLRQGLALIYGSNGSVIERYTYVNDSLHGKYEAYFDTGEKEIVSNYSHGLLHGPFMRFHRNGKVYSQGDYKNGKAEGVWKFYHDNGKLREEAIYKDDHVVGQFKLYNRYGKLTEINQYNDDGIENGESRLYSNSNLYCVLKTDNGMLTAAIYYDSAGKELATYQDNNGKLIGKSHYQTGEVKSEYSYQDGKPNGIWRFYTRSGILETENPYVEGKLHGRVVAYHPNKTIKSITNYQNGLKHGLYQEFYLNGQISLQGWYQEDLPQQRWISYHSNGKIKSDEFFINNQQLGEAYYYATDGKLYNQDEMANDILLNYYLYDLNGNRISEAVRKDGKLKVQTNYKTGTPSQQLEFNCGILSGDRTVWLPDGKLFRLNAYLNGKLHGAYKRFWTLGEPLNTGSYINGNAEGKWTWYYLNGKVETIGNYINDSRDSIWTYYYENGMVERLVNYQEDKRQGITKVFGLDGQLVLEKLYDAGEFIAYRFKGAASDAWIKFSGTGIVTAKYANGKTALEEKYENGKLHGLEKVFYPTGQLYSQTNYKYGLYDGQMMQYYSNGKIRLKRFYTLDQEDKEIEWYDEAGNLERKEMYELGFLNGVSSIYQNGRKVKEVKFWYGLPVE